MNTKKFLAPLLLSLFLFACTTQFATLPTGKKIDSRLVGVWNGAENDQQIEGLQKSWEMNRRADGTFTLDFKFTQDGKSQETVEIGEWWIAGGKFYEFHEGSGETDIYQYTVLNEDQIKFKSLKMSQTMTQNSYEFIDNRK